MVQSARRRGPDEVDHLELELVVAKNVSVLAGRTPPNAQSRPTLVKIAVELAKFVQNWPVKKLSICVSGGRLEGVLLPFCLFLVSGSVTPPSPLSFSSGPACTHEGVLQGGLGGQGKL